MVIGPNPEEQLAPYHEFECTGRDDQYVQDVDETEKHRTAYATATTTKLVAPDGAMHCPYDDQFYHVPTADEVAVIGRIAGTGSNGKLSWNSKDWGDGLGYSTRVRHVPAGWEEREVNTRDVQSFVDYCVEDRGSGRALLPGEAPKGADKYGYVQLGSDGEVARVIDRTNPNAHWDWYALGGRWRGMLKLRVGHENEGRAAPLDKYDVMDGVSLVPGWADAALKRAIDFEGMMDAAGTKAASNWDLLTSLIGDFQLAHSWADILEDTTIPDFDVKRAVHQTQPALLRAEAAAHRLMQRRHEGSPALEAQQSLLSGFRFDPDHYQGTRDQFIERARAQAVCTFAVVKDGQWYERGQMGWWGVVHDEKDRDAWQRQVRELLLGLSGDTLISIYDCHI
jgi:hypothetical protein